jgi:hypothetical protein
MKELIGVLPKVCVDCTIHIKNESDWRQQVKLVNSVQLLCPIVALELNETKEEIKVTVKVWRLRIYFKFIYKL